LLKDGPTNIAQSPTKRDPTKPTSIASPGEQIMSAHPLMEIPPERAQAAQTIGMILPVKSLEREIPAKVAPTNENIVLIIILFLWLPSAYPALTDGNIMIMKKQPMKAIV
jgi:hypothetical protein